MIDQIVLPKLIRKFPDLNIKLQSTFVNATELNIRILDTGRLLDILRYLKDTEDLYFQQLIDITVVDYLNYALVNSDFITTANINSNNVVIHNDKESKLQPNNELNFRFGIVYQLLSLRNNFRITVQFMLHNDNVTVPSCVDLWPIANWYERELFDLFGIMFLNHPKLVTMFNQENFKQYPFRKDFPTTGYVEARFDAKQQKVVYEPVDLQKNSEFHKISYDNLPEEII